MATGTNSLVKKALNCDPVSSFGGVIALNSILIKTALEQKIFLKLL